MSSDEDGRIARWWNWEKLRQLTQEAYEEGENWQPQKESPKCRLPQDVGWRRTDPKQPSGERYAKKKSKKMIDFQKETLCLHRSNILSGINPLTSRRLFLCQHVKLSAQGCVVAVMPTRFSLRNLNNTDCAFFSSKKLKPWRTKLESLKAHNSGKFAQLEHQMSRCSAWKTYVMYLSYKLTKWRTDSKKMDGIQFHSPTRWVESSWQRLSTSLTSTEW